MTIDELLDEHGRTYAEEAGIPLKDTPSPLFELLVLTLLLSTRIKADIAVAAARELTKAGYRTPAKMADAMWQDLVDALGRGHYKRYDESTATRLIEMGKKVCGDYDGDLRNLAETAETVEDASALIQEFTGIGPTGADIFLREVQDVWPQFSPFFDERARETAADLGLPTDPAKLAAQAPGNRVAVLAAALVRKSLS